MCRNLASEIFSVMSTHNIGRTAGIKFIPHLASLFKGTQSLLEKPVKSKVDGLGSNLLKLDSHVSN